MEETSASSYDEERFRVEVLFSPGADGDPFSGDPSGGVEVAPLRILSDNITLKEFESFLTAAQLAGRT
jgi:hypothetical protein